MTDNIEYWVPLKPEGIDAFRCLVRKVTFDETGFTIEMENHQKEIFSVWFEPGSVRAYQSIEESFLLDQSSKLDSPGWSVNTVQNSSFLKEIHEK